MSISLSLQGRVVAQTTRRRVLSRSHVFDDRTVHVWFVVDKVALGEVIYSPSASIFPWHYHSMNAPHSSSSTCCIYQTWARQKPGNLPKSNYLSETWEYLYLYLDLPHSTERTCVLDTTPLHNLRFKAYSGCCLFVETMRTERWIQRIRTLTF